MKKFTAFAVLFVSFQLFPQSIIKQISHINNDARNFQFIQSNPAGVWFGEVGYLFESHTDSTINLYLGTYSVNDDSFYNQHPFTSNSSKNINAVGRYYSYLPDIFILYQSNRNGNWDIFARIFRDSIWSGDILLFGSPSDEINPVLIRDSEFFFADDSVKFLYTSDNSVYLATWQDSILRNIEIFSGNDSTAYTSYDASYFYLGYNNPLNGKYITAKKSREGYAPQIVYRILSDGGTLSPEIIIAESPTLDNPGYSIFNFHANFHYEEVVNGKRNILIFQDWPYSTNVYNLLMENPGGNLSDFTTAPVMIVTKDQQFNKRSDIFIYECHSYKLSFSDSAFIRVNYDDYNIWVDTLIYTRVANTPIVTGETGLDGYNMVFYTVWEDSLDDRIGIVGRRFLFPIGSAKYESNDLSFYIHQNYPNPFNPSTNIEYRLSKPGYVTIRTFDVLGNEIRTMVNEEQSAGDYKIIFDGSGLSSGIYFYRIQVNDSFQTKKMILLR